VRKAPYGLTHEACFFEYLRKEGFERSDVFAEDDKNFFLGVFPCLLEDGNEILPERGGGIPEDSNKAPEIVSVLSQR
jgi:hypothetical protein